MNLAVIVLPRRYRPGDEVQPLEMLRQALRTQVRPLAGGLPEQRRAHGGHPSSRETSMTTVAPAAGTCRFTDRRCAGRCGAGMQCGAAAGTASCECRAVTCADADAPECAGACPDPRDACIFAVTGCRCVRIP